MKTIAEQMNAKTFPFKLYDVNGNIIYFAHSTGYCFKQEFDADENLVYHEDLTGYWYKQKYDKNNKVIRCKESNGNWWKREYDEDGNEIYFENVDGVMLDNRTKQFKEVTMSDIEAKFGCVVKIIKEK